MSRSSFMLLSGEKTPVNRLAILIAGALIVATASFPLQAQEAITPMVSCVELLSLDADYLLSAAAPAGATSVSLSLPLLESLPQRPFILMTIDPAGPNEETVILTREPLIWPSTFSVSQLAKSHSQGERVRIRAQKSLAIFGYQNSNNVSATVRIGEPNNYFFPSPQDRGQPERFSPGLVPHAFAVLWDIEQEPLLSWIIGGRTAVASATSPRCGGNGLQLALRGVWQESTSYFPGEVVTAAGSSWVALRENHDVSPTEGNDWLLLAEKGAAGPAGPRGEIGPAGPTGPQGEQGPAGLPGSGAGLLLDTIIITADSTSRQSVVTAECPSDYLLLTGGGDCGKNPMMTNQPQSATSWQVQCASGVAKAKAVCVRAQQP